MTVVWAWCPKCQKESAGKDIGNGMYACPSCNYRTVIARVEVPYSEGGQK